MKLRLRNGLTGGKTEKRKTEITLIKHAMRGEYKMKRVVAWALLAGFVLLLINILFIHFYMVESLTIYVVVALSYWFILRRYFNNIERKNEE